MDVGFGQIESVFSGDQVGESVGSVSVQRHLRLAFRVQGKIHSDLLLQYFLGELMNSIVTR